MSLSVILLVFQGRDSTLKSTLRYATDSRDDYLPEIRQVIFAKVHKTGSGTIQNILLRFALSRNLSVLLPIKGNNIGQHSEGIPDHQMLPHPEGKAKFDILCSHVVYNATEIARYFPPNAIRVAILRNPMKQALSALVYFATKYPTSQLQVGQRKHPNDSINGFLRHPEDFYRPSKSSGALMSFTNNRMSLDLGFDSTNLSSSKKNITKIDAFIQNVHREFDFVLISEYFDESMVLLRRHLRWSMKDIIYLRRNTAKQLPVKRPFRPKPNITADVTESFRRWALIDYKLYEYFLPIFLDTIKSEVNFADEVKAFKEIQAVVVEFCSKANARQSIQFEKSVYSEGFTLTKSECDVMSSQEYLKEHVKQKQIGRYKEYKKRLDLEQKVMESIFQ